MNVNPNELKPICMNCEAPFDTADVMNRRRVPALESLTLCSKCLDSYGEAKWPVRLARWFMWGMLILFGILLIITVKEI